MSARGYAIIAPGKARVEKAKLRITCPEWCTVTAEHHASQLYDQEGTCIHESPDLTITDKTGIQAALRNPKFTEDVTLRFTLTTSPVGAEIESPVFFINDGDGHSLEQFLAIADAIRDTVALYYSTREAGFHG